MSACSGFKTNLAMSFSKVPYSPDFFGVTKKSCQFSPNRSFHVDRYNFAQYRLYQSTSWKTISWLHLLKAALPRVEAAYSES